MSDARKLVEATGRDLERLAERERRPATLVGMLLYGGTLGLFFVVPIIGGAYLGRWIDAQFAGYAVRWTVSLIVLGIVIGIINVMHFIRSRT